MSSGAVIHQQFSMRLSHARGNGSESEMQQVWGTVTSHQNRGFAKPPEWDFWRTCVRSIPRSDHCEAAWMDRFPDKRRGMNTTGMGDIGMAAFSVFFMPSRSFLAHQRQFEEGHGRSNGASLFGIAKIPSDNHIRDMLDPASPTLLHPVNCSVSALRFLFTVTLDRPDLSRGLVLVHHLRKLPSVLSVEELGQLLEAPPMAPDYA
jgi:hypothetical protein